MTARSRVDEFLHTIGLDRSPTSHRGSILAGVGTILGILMVALVSRSMLGIRGALWIVPSLGATAVLVFAVPDAPLSKPWNVVVGHVVSAIVGVAVARYVPDESIVLATALAAGLSVTAMHYARAIHPPGGATAMIAVLGGDAIRQLGFAYVLNPILLCVGSMMLGVVGFRVATSQRTAVVVREKVRRWSERPPA